MINLKIYPQLTLLNDPFGYVRVSLCDRGFLFTFMGYIKSSAQINKRIRVNRLSIAIKKGSHTKKEWDEMKLFFNNTCCRCLNEFNPESIEKDHIIPIYLNGSNHLRNLQPICEKCNSSKGCETIDWRPRLSNKLGKELPYNYKNPF